MKKKRPHKTDEVVRIWLPTMVCVLLAVLLLTFSKPVGDGMRRGLALCANVVIPSLFPFMALSGFVATSRVSLALNRLLRPVTRHVLRLPDSAAAPLLMGFIGGYPVGARTLAAMVRERRISPEIAGRMLCFCVNAGPPFLLSAVGAGMLGSLRLGVLLLAAQVASALFFGFLLGLRAPRMEREIPAPQGFRPYSYCFVQSVGDAAAAMMPICAFVALFAALGSVLDATGALDTLAALLSVCGLHTDAARALLAGLLEVTNGCYMAATAGSGGLYVIAALVSLSGISVVFQVLAAVHGSGIPVRGFLLSRLGHGALTLGVFSLLIRIFPQALEVFGSATLPMRTVSGTPGSSASLLLMCAVFLLSAGARSPLMKWRKAR